MQDSKARCTQQMGQRFALANKTSCGDGIICCDCMRMPMCALASWHSVTSCRILGDGASEPASPPRELRELRGIRRVTSRINQHSLARWFCSVPSGSCCGTPAIYPAGPQLRFTHTGASASLCFVPLLAFWLCCWVVLFRSGARYRAR